MITPEARRELYAETDDEDVRAMVLQWHGGGDVELPEELPRRERFKVLEEHFAAVKEPLLTSLRAAGVAVRDLPASPQAIVQATPSQWRALLEREDLNSDPSVEILPNIAFHTLG